MLHYAVFIHVYHHALIVFIPTTRPQSHLPPNSPPFLPSWWRSFTQQADLTKSSESHWLPLLLHNLHRIDLWTTQIPPPHETGARQGLPSLRGTSEKVCTKAERGRSCGHLSLCLDPGSPVMIHILPVFLSPLQREVPLGSPGIWSHDKPLCSLVSP